MIQQIDHLRDFGIYRNFQWGGLSVFAKRNLIYGWNYSGKTTLSRLFQVLEKPEQLCISKVINGLKAKDFHHYESLCAVIGATP